MKNDQMNLTNHFLIAMPNMDDPNFQQTVTYICEHNENGALGIVINRPLEIELSEVLGQMQIDVHSEAAGHIPVLYGGPIHQERGFVLHRPFGQWKSSFETADGIVVTTSRDILQDIAQNGCPKEILVTLGYAGWGSGQLEEELSNNLWLVAPADPHVIFDVPWNQRWTQAGRLLGIDIHTITGYAGHA